MRETPCAKMCVLSFACQRMWLACVQTCMNKRGARSAGTIPLTPISESIPIARRQMIHCYLRIA